MNAQSVNHEKFRENIARSSNWIRLLYMLMYGVILHLAGLVMWVLCGLQFLFALLTGKDNENLRDLGGSIAVFVHQALDFVCYNTEKKPFPFAAWPDSPYETRRGDSVVIVEEESDSGQADDGRGEDTDNSR